MTLDRDMEREPDLEDIDYWRDLCFDLFRQGCWVSYPEVGRDPSGYYQRSGISTYEEAKEALIKVGFIKPEECK